MAHIDGVVPIDDRPAAVEVTALAPSPNRRLLGARLIALMVAVVLATAVLLWLRPPHVTVTVADTGR